MDKLVGEVLGIMMGACSKILSLTECEVAVQNNRFLETEGDHGNFEGYTETLSPKL